MVTIFSTAILLLAFFDFHVCQRKVSRNVAVGADVKTVVSFDCPEEFGYYPHPSDCTQYYVCVFGGALLESCTGGLMYSHELQTCDWPRNVGCDGTELSGGPVTVSSPRAPAKPREEQTRTRYPPPTPQPPQPAAIVTSRGQPRPLHHNQQEIIKQRQQQQLYAEAEETLPPAEEVENDRQQRVYRGQPSTVGQVQRDRDGLRHTNAIPSYNGRNGKIGVISFGTQHQQPYSTTIIDINNNDLTLKRRRKRQVQVSHHHRYPESWRVDKNRKNNNYIRTTPLTLQPPPLQPQFSQRYPQQHYAQTSEEFKPFVPQYKRNNYRTHTVANKIPFSQTPVSNDYQNYAYFNIGSVTTYRPNTNPKKLETIYYNNEPQYSHLSSQNISKLLVSTTLEPTTTDEPKLEEPLENYDEENKEKDNEEFTFYEDLRPPPSYFDNKNKYEEIENPFANPNFDFDKFLDGLRGYPGSVVVPKQQTQVVPKQQAQETSLPSRNKTVPQEYYFYDNDYSNHTNKPPLKSKNLYSSQVKPTAAISLVKTTNKPPLDYYYEYDYPEYSKATDPNDKYYYYEDVKRPKYSAKYQEKPLKVATVRYTTVRTTPRTIATKKLTTTTTAPTTTTISTTTTTSTTTTVKPRPKPKHIRQRVNASTRKQKTARPPPTTTTTTTTTTTEKRPRLTNTIDDDNVRQRVEPSSSAPVQAPSSTVPTVTARTLYNSTQYNNNNNNNNNNYDPYYALYDDDVELYRDVDYAQHYSNNNNNNAQNQTPRRTPAPVIHQTPIQEEPPKRGNTAYIQNNYGSQDIYQPSTVSDYNEDNNYNTEEDDQNAYRQQQINRQPTRGNRNELNYIEEATTKRAATTTTTRKPTTTTTTTTTTTSTTPPRTIPFKSTTISQLPVTANETQAQSIINSFRKNPGQPLISSNNITTYSFTTHNSSLGLDSTATNIITYRPTLHEPIAAVVNKPTPFTLPKHLTEKPTVFHYITKSPRSTLVSTTALPDNDFSSTTESSNEIKYQIIVPTTYSPPKFFLKSLIPKPNKTVIDSSNKPHKTLKSIRKLISPIIVNYGLSSVTESNFESAEKLVPDIRNILPVNFNHPIKPSTSASTNIFTTLTTPKTVTLTVSNFKKLFSIDNNKDFELNHNNFTDFQTTVEIPNNEFDQVYERRPDPDHKLKFSLPKPTTDVPLNSSTTARASRVNPAIKSLIAFGGPRRQNLKCHDGQSANSKCNDPKQRTNTRGRGSAHYANSGNIINNEVSVTVNRGTPASRSRPTLKPSTSIVAKASEFIDIYKFPPTRPEAIYPQPQPDKTAAKCRKDVCLLPDCSCGGKEIPGDIPVEQVPQIVLLTFDDSVNDLNKGLYSDLFEKGRVNPNGCPIAATFYVSHEWTDYSQVQNLYADGHELASHTVSHSFGEQFSQKKWTREVSGQREILSAYGGVRLEDVKGMRAPFLSVGGNKMFKMLYDSNFTYDSSMPIYENKPPSWPYTLDYKLFHDCMIPPCPTRSYPGVWEVPMVMWQDLNGGRCSMGDACSNPPDAEGVFKMITKNFQRHYTTNRAPFGLFYHAAWFTQPHHKEGFINFLDSILSMKDVWLVTNWQAIQWIRDPTPISRLGSFQPFQCDYSNRPKRCNAPKVCNLWHKSGVRYMRTCQPCPDIYPWTGNTGIRSSRIDNDIED